MWHLAVCSCFISTKKLIGKSIRHVNYSQLIETFTERKDDIAISIDMGQVTALTLLDLSATDVSTQTLEV